MPTMNRTAIPIVLVFLLFANSGRCQSVGPWNSKAVFEDLGTIKFQLTGEENEVRVVGWEGEMIVSKLPCRFNNPEGFEFGGQSGAAGVIPANDTVYLPLKGTDSVMGRGVWIGKTCADIMPDIPVPPLVLTATPSSNLRVTITQFSPNSEFLTVIENLGTSRDIATWLNDTCNPSESSPLPSLNSSVVTAPREINTYTDYSLDLTTSFIMSFYDDEVNVNCTEFVGEDECRLAPCGVKAECRDPRLTVKGDFICSCLSPSVNITVGVMPVCNGSKSDNDLLTLMLLIGCGVVFVVFMGVILALMAVRKKYAQNDAMFKKLSGPELMQSTASFFQQLETAERDFTATPNPHPNDYLVQNAAFRERKSSLVEMLDSYSKPSPAELEQKRHLSSVWANIGNLQQTADMAMESVQEIERNTAASKTVEL
eukprot:TRINITY_DN3824_c1_g1_i1.p1 TRINITY_DN3824_c1_g1~~TRINITY_DN3824_c1_g1_i1.p1  ORF type:complete len:426 (+),score=55.24 TRINITY_DN3824_c1_g1_i1:72-1349(+)